MFVVMKQGLDTEYTVIELPQRLHWPLRRLLIINRLNHVNSFYLEYMGLTYCNEPILRAHGGGSVYFYRSSRWICVCKNKENKLIYLFLSIRCPAPRFTSLSRV